MAADLNSLKQDLTRRMDGALETLRREFSGLRSGRASPALLEPVRVEAYGTETPLTQVGTMTLLVRLVPAHLMARGQGYFAACSGLVSSCAAILSGLVYARYGQGVYYMMVAMALSGAILIWLARHRLADPHPHSVASGG